jgi:ATP-dependent phosphofructokinase / diphosphate-dependent phosphofructokinase
MTQSIGILTSGGDTPGLNAAIRGVGKACVSHYGMHIIGFRDGFRGLMENRTMELEGEALSGILTKGGTILGTSRDKPHKMPVNGKVLDMTETIVASYHANQLDCLVCLGGGGTMKNALRLQQAGLNIVTLPKTIDNDVALTETTFGFDTALGIATDAIDRLHSTAHSHHRIIVVEIMGHRAGWLALGAGIAGGADVILIPEIPYSVEAVAQAIKERKRKGKPFSIVAVAEGALSQQEFAAQQASTARKKDRKAKEIVAEPELVYAERTPASGASTRIAHRTGSSPDHPRSPAARRHALRRRPPARHASGHGRSRPDTCQAIRLHGRRARRIERASGTGRSRRPGQDCPARPSLGGQRARRGDKFRRLSRNRLMPRFFGMPDLNLR